MKGKSQAADWRFDRLTNRMMVKRKEASEGVETWAPKKYGTDFQKHIILLFLNQCPSIVSQLVFQVFVEDRSHFSKSIFSVDKQKIQSGLPLAIGRMMDTSSRLINRQTSSQTDRNDSKTRQTRQPNTTDKTVNHDRQTYRRSPWIRDEVVTVGNKEHAWVRLE